MSGYLEYLLAIIHVMLNEQNLSIPLPPITTSYQNIYHVSFIIMSHDLARSEQDMEIGIIFVSSHVKIGEDGKLMGVYLDKVPPNSRGPYWNRKLEGDSLEFETTWDLGHSDEGQILLQI